MGRPSPVKGTNLGHRDYIRCCLVLDFMNEGQISSSALKHRYYQDLSSESFHKTFKRDRDALEDEGIFLTQHKDGTEKRWALRKDCSLADISCFPEIERRACAILLHAYMNNPELTNTNGLGASVARIGQDICSGLQLLPASTPLCKKDVLQTVAEAHALRKPLQITYKSLEDEHAEERIVQPWGLFSIGQHIYMVGMRSKEGQTDALRTLNLERVVKATALTNTEPFSVPGDFVVDDYRLLPFEIGTEPTQKLSVYIAPNNVSEFKAAVRKRGRFEVTSDSGLQWSGSMKDTALAASWIAEVGAIPTEPKALIEAWESLCREALNEDN